MVMGSVLRSPHGARGFHPRITDRIDLTLECIRRHYQAEDSPRGEVLARYGDFFALFEDFRGYVDFWLLHVFVFKPTLVVVVWQLVAVSITVAGRCLVRLIGAVLADIRDESQSADNRRYLAEGSMALLYPDRATGPIVAINSGE